MKRVLLVPIAVAALVIPAMVSAAGLSFAYNTGNFDFEDYEIDTGYIGLAMTGNQLDVQVSSAGSVSAIPSISVVVYGPTLDALGRDVYPTLGQLGDVHLYGPGGNQGFDVLHSDAKVGSVASAYVNALTELGFTAKELTTGTANILSYDFMKNGDTLHGVFHQDGANVTAHLVVGSGA